MKKILLAFTVCLCSVATAETIELNLSEESSTIKYDEKGLWSDVFKSNMVSTSKFMFTHQSPYPNYSCGFFPSKVSTIQGNATVDDQWGCMAKGGYAGEGTPFLGAYWDSYNDSPDSRVCMVYNLYSYYALGLYVCNNPYTYYSMQEGNDFSKKFEQGDWLKLIIHAKNKSNQEVTPVEVYLADYRSDNPDDWTMLDTWEWVDLSRMGEVTSFYFTMESSDTGDYGMSTPAYFCIDRLTLTSEMPAAIEQTELKPVAYYNRAADQLCVTTEQPVEVSVYAVNGTLLKRAIVERTVAWDMSDYPAGVYIMRCGNHSVKVIK